ncbi:MAG TPA: ATP-binding protein, partial [Mycobacteriales bacterium]|nr:ATP-binding protein [Mycobacteriales bacterium]
MLQAWADAPARFREDANTEEDFALGGYRDRLIVELAQNAADAATRAGVPGVLSISWDGSVLTAANTGAPLDSDGVIALASLRASAKAGGTVGRFGVGFSAVLAVSDEPEVISRTGGICFSASRTRAEVERIPELAAESGRRSGHVPVLRLPWPVAGEPPEGFDTAVRLPVRPDTRAAIPDLLANVPAELLLSLPGLQEIRIGERVISRSETDHGVRLHDGSSVTTWHVSSVDGRIPAELLADRPTEERHRDHWEITWAVPVDSGGNAAALGEPPVLHAPTASAQPVSVPALLIATVPLDPDRRHVARSRLTDYLIERAGEFFPDFVQGLPAGPARLRLVPDVRLGADAFDSALIEACLQNLRSASFLADQECARLSVLERDISAAAPALSDVVDGLLDSEWSAVSHEAALRSLGVRRLSAAHVVELVSTVERPAEWWGRLYAGLQDAADRDALAGLPVPLVDGRLVTGARGAFLVEGEAPGAVEVLGLRVIAPAAAHPLLERLGARPASAFSLLQEDAVRAAVAE